MWQVITNLCQGFRGVLKSLKLYKKVLIMISRGLKFGDGKSRIAIWLNVTIKLQKAMKHERCMFKVRSCADLCTALMPSSHCTILARFFTRRQVLINRRQMPKLEARSREWQSRSVNYQRRDLRESPMRRWRPWNIWHAKYLELSAIHNHAVCNDFWLKTTSAMTFSQWETKIQDRGKFGEEL